MQDFCFVCEYPFLFSQNCNVFPPQRNWFINGLEDELGFRHNVLPFVAALRVQIFVFALFMCHVLFVTSTNVFVQYFEYFSMFERMV